jgi:hypothetical protein
MPARITPATLLLVIVGLVALWYLIQVQAAGTAGSALPRLTL